MTFRKITVAAIVALFCFNLVSSETLVRADEPTNREATKTTAGDEVKPNKDEVELSENEREFQKLLSNAKLVGQFTVTGKEMRKPQTEEYTISRISKTTEKDLWVFMARVKYEKNDYTVPLTLNVKWADDTPMITLTDLTILGQGPFSARVLFHDNKYAGTWSHGEVGGHLFGTIERADAKPDESEKESK